jgi:hypothetical protein
MHAICINWFLKHVLCQLLTSEKTLFHGEVNCSYLLIEMHRIYIPRIHRVSSVRINEAEPKIYNRYTKEWIGRWEKKSALIAIPR